MGTRTANGGAGGKSAKRIGGKVASSPTGAKASKSKVNQYGVDRILRNLAGCTQTPDEEMSSYKKIIESVVQRHGQDDVVAVEMIQAEVARQVGQKSKYFLGENSPFHQGRDVWHTKRSSYLEARLDREINRTTYGSDYRVSDTAKNIMERLRNPGQWRDAVMNSGYLSLHDPGTPFWIADPTSGRPDPSLRKEYYPARAGIAPDDGIYEYVLLPLRVQGPATCPRFADSGGYPYWCPGGKTEPIVGSPDGHSGFDEAVTDHVTLGCLVAEPQFFIRTC